MIPAVASRNWIDLAYSSRDGLRLHARKYPAPDAMRRPVVCLPGLTRNSRDFHTLATVLSDPRGARRTVYAVDYRGRGLSDPDPDPTRYTVLNELGDVLDLMTIEGIADAAIVGTSRGGLIAMAMAAARPGALGAVVLNDIGPVLEAAGLARIIAYVGRMPLPRDWNEAAAQVRSINRRDFTALSDAEWEEFARQVFNEENGRPAPAYDKSLAKAISIGSGPRPELWPQFAALARVPVVAIRGANSDLLSADTVAEMARRHPRLRTYTAPAEGHAPLLKDAGSIRAIVDFLEAAEPALPLR
jgi:pimeloyl-ACP methyl ester carboxylesterase